MPLRLLFALLLVTSSIDASIRMFDGIEWKVRASKYNTSLYWQVDDVTRVEFQKIAGQPLAFCVTSPHLLEGGNSASLFMMSSPLAIKKEKTPIDRVTDMKEAWLSDRRTLHFKNKIPVLLDGMEDGSWGVIELQMPSGVQQVIEVPAIDFAAPLQQFNKERSTLPLMTWEQAADYNLLFASGQFELNSHQKRQLQKLIEVINYDGEVKSIEIDGHADVSGHRLKNLTLSQKRSLSVKKFLLAQGVTESLMTAVRHHGQRYSIPGTGLDKNRRVEIRLRN